MRYIYIIPTICLFGTISLYANEDKLSSILQKTGEEKVLPKPVTKKKTSKKQSRFVFKDEFNSNGIGQIDKTASKEKSQSYNYDNKSRFKFKFNDGYQQSNLINRYGGGTMAGSGSIGGGTMAGSGSIGGGSFGSSGAGGKGGR